MWKDNGSRDRRRKSEICRKDITIIKVLKIINTKLTDKTKVMKMDVIEVDASNWDTQVMADSCLVVVDFWREGCIWCKRLDPIFEKVANAEKYEEQVKFVKFNAMANDANQAIATKYGVMSTPTLLFICEGIPVATFMGFQKEDRLKQIIDHVLETHRACMEESERL
ncbi:MAG: thioredoxin family protein [Promethearchaeota archaeon]